MQDTRYVNVNKVKVIVTNADTGEVLMDKTAGVCIISVAEEFEGSAEMPVVTSNLGKPEDVLRLLNITNEQILNNIKTATGGIATPGATTAKGVN